MNYKDVINTVIKRFLREDMVAGGTGSVFSYGSTPANPGNTGGGFGNKDSWNPGNAMPFDPKNAVLGIKNRKRRRTKTAKGGSTAFQNVVKNVASSLPIQRRDLQKMMTNSFNYEVPSDSILLGCALIIKDIRFNNIVKILLEKFNIVYSVNEENDRTIFTFCDTDKVMENVGNGLNKLFSEEVLEQNIAMLIYESIEW